jgi:hypothetical protein
VCGLRAAFRIRARGRDERLEPVDRQLFWTAGNALIASIVGFLVGGAFIAMALNDITWLSFAMAAALDRISRGACEEAERSVAKSLDGRQSMPAFQPAFARA